MGVPGLWERINPAGESRAITHLAVVDGFEKNAGGTRSWRVGIDASIWLEHATYSAGPRTREEDRGKNAELRMLFFRLCKLSRLPVSLLFVFDGRKRPKTKRGSKKGKSGSHRWAPGFKRLIELFGMEWREALGEAEAELAYLNYSGSIDAIITDDVDALVFGARVVIKNFSLNLSGNKAHPAVDANGKPSVNHGHVYTQDNIKNHPEVQLTRGGLILIALLAGGDYDGAGIRGIGVKLAHGLARAGFGDTLYNAYKSRQTHDFQVFAFQWCTDIQEELRTNSRGLLPERRTNVVFPPGWPDKSIVGSYADPLTSESLGHTGGGAPKDRREIDLPGLTAFCENHFDEWAHRSRLLYRLKSLLTQGLVMTLLKASAFEADKREEDRRAATGVHPRDIRVTGLLRPHPGEGVGTNAAIVKKCLMPKPKRGSARGDALDRISAAFVRRDSPEPEVEERLPRGVDIEDRHPVVVGISRTREHVSTDMVPEYRVEICPRQFVDIEDKAIKGKHPESHPLPASQGLSQARGDDSDDEAGDDGDGDKDPKDPNSNLRIWIPVSIMRQVHPELVDQFEQDRRQRQERRSPKKRTALSQAKENEAPGPSNSQASASTTTRSKGKGKARARPNADEEYIFSHNPCASSKPPTRDIDPFASSSLPRPSDGFLFSWPDPDDPDRLVVDTEARDDLPTMLDYGRIDGLDGAVFREYAAAAPLPGASQCTPVASSSKSKRKERASTAADARDSAPKRRRAVARTPGDDHAADMLWDEPQVDSQSARLNMEVDRLLLGGFGGHSKKSTRGRRPRASAPVAATRGVGIPSQAVEGLQPKTNARREPPAARAAKRRKTTQGSFAEHEPARPSQPAARIGFSENQYADDSEVRNSQPRATTSASVSQPNSEPLFYQSDPDEFVFDRSPSPFFLRASSPLLPPPPPSSSTESTLKAVQALRTKSTEHVLDNDVISIDSPGSDQGPAGTCVDDDDGWMKMDLFSGLPSFRRRKKRLESAPSLNMPAHPYASGAPEPDREDGDDGIGRFVPMPRPSTPPVSSDPRRGGHRSTHGRPSESSASAASKYRDLPLPTSSQDSTLSDSRGFLGDASVVINLCSP